MSTAGKVISCKAAIAWEAKKPFSIEEVQVAPPQKRQVRIKMVATGVCHSDAVTWGGHDSNALFPVILGHEGAGIVESVGEGVIGFQPGDHVIPVFVPKCNECKFCKSNKTNICDKIHDVPGAIALGKGTLLNGETPFTCKGKPIHHYMGTSTFSEYTVVDDIFLCKINEKAPLDIVCLLGCGISTGYGAAINTAQVRPGSTCAVWGLGGVGLAVVMGCKRAGASKIYGIDINPAKFELGKKFGVTDFVNPKDVEGPISEYLIKLTGGGFDYTFESVGNINTMRAAFESTHSGWGVAVVIGVAPTGQEISTIPVNLVIGRTWKGSAYGGFNVIDVPHLVEEYMNGKIMLDEFITHNVSLEKINDAFDFMLGGKGLRTVVKFQ